MTKRYTSTTLKKNNTKNVLKYIYTKRKATPHSVEEYLGLSRPTVAQILKDLTEEGFIAQEGYARSTGGRKANIFSFNMSNKIAIGVELRIDHVEITAINLFFNMLKYDTVHIGFNTSDEYFDEVSLIIQNFIDSLNVPHETILGIGIGLQALVSADGKTIVYGKVLDCTGLSISKFTDRLPYRCVFNHDAESFANAELWLDKTLVNAIFFNIHEHLSGTVIINRSFPRGRELKSGVFEHMTLVPNGKKCYCGKKGCVNAYCSFSALTGPDDDIESFFLSLREEDDSAVKGWNEYLGCLAAAIDNIHMILPYDVILGGKIAKFLTQEDIDALHKLVHARSAFPSDDRYIGISKATNLPLCVGAAIPLVNKYLEKIC